MRAHDNTISDNVRGEATGKRARDGEIQEGERATWKEGEQAGGKSTFCLSFICV